jgi:hypothetical protein
VLEIKPRALYILGKQPLGYILNPKMWKLLEVKNKVSDELGVFIHTCSLSYLETEIGSIATPSQPGQKMRPYLIQ